MTTLTKPPTTHGPASAPRPIPRRHLAGLDGLRAVAVIVVILYHVTPGFLPGGYIGVDVFFVLSGFLITGLLIGEKQRTGRIALGMFWRRRARRLLPALGILVLLCCTTASIIGGDLLVGLGKQVVGAATFSSNWLAIATENSYFSDAVPDLFRNLWSLSVEEQFYLLWPLVVLALLVIHRRSLRLTLVLAGAVGSAVAMALIFSPNSDATRVYFGTDTHSFGLALGAALAIATQFWSPDSLEWPKQLRFWLPIGGAVALAGLLAASAYLAADLPVSYRGGLALVAVLTAVTIGGCIVPGSFLGRSLDVGPLRWIGQRSYGLYLWHWPVFVLVFSALQSWERIGVGGWALGGIALGITIAAAALSYRFIEQPILRNGFRRTISSLGGKIWHSRLRRVATVTGTLLVLTASTMSIGAIASDPGASDAQLNIQAGQNAIATQPNPPVPPPPTPTPLPTPAPRASPSPLTGDRVSAIGDSVMLASAPELQAALPGIAIDAVVSRQMRQAPSIVQSMRDQGTLRHFVVIGLGTNGPISPTVLDEIRSAAEGDHQIVFVNIYAPRGYMNAVNSSLTQFAQQYSDVGLADWCDAIAKHLNLLSRDQIHPGKTGGQIYTDVVAKALNQLAAETPLQPDTSPIRPFLRDGSSSSAGTD